MSSTSTAVASQAAGAVAPTSYTIAEFCRRFGISSPTYYAMRAEGRGPREIRMGRSVVRISAEAAEDWRRERESATDDEHYQRMKARSRHATSGGAR